MKHIVDDLATFHGMVNNALVAKLPNTEEVWYVIHSC